jgi:hypothetical protein
MFVFGYWDENQTCRRQAQCSYNGIFLIEERVRQKCSFVKNMASSLADSKGF